MSGSNKYHQRHALNASYVSKAQPNQCCQYVWLSHGQLQHCFAETSGKTYCAECEAERSQAHSGSRYAGVRSVGKWSHMS